MRRIFILTSVLAVMFSLCYAVAGDDCIIDPELMNKGITAEPVWGVEAPPHQPGGRDIASVEPAQEVSAEAAEKFEKNPSQYLEVLKKIPSTEPSLHRGWFESSILSE